jgi:hypothetical protein
MIQLPHGVRFILLSLPVLPLLMAFSSPETGPFSGCLNGCCTPPSFATFVDWSTGFHNFHRRLLQIDSADAGEAIDFSRFKRYSIHHISTNFSS